MRSLKIFFLLAAFCTSFIANAQTDSCNLRISLLTCGPGADLYSIFGHSGFRVIDRNSRADVVFNYGTFVFDDDFYSKFVHGILIYSVSEERMNEFMVEYEEDKRNVIEQELLISCEEKQRLYDALRKNALPQNRFYNYQYLFDNCSTRLRDMLKKNLNDSVRFKRILPPSPPSFRNMLHVCLDNGKQYWSEFGIDLVLGSRIDRKVENEEAMFLPNYLSKGFDSAVVNNKSIVGPKRTILPAGTREDDTGFAVTPLMVTGLLCVAGLVLTLTRLRMNDRANIIFDAAYFSFLGLLGCFMLFMWLGTDHVLCADNYNVLWALPTHAVMVFFLRSDKKFVSVYFLATAVIGVILMLTWAVFPQQFHRAFFPLILLSAVRAWAIAFKQRQHARETNRA